MISGSGVAGVLVEDRLFATLDPTTRQLGLPDGRTLLVNSAGRLFTLPVDGSSGPAPLALDAAVRDDPVVAAVTITLEVLP